jgi:hypothetical protein
MAEDKKDEFKFYTANCSWKFDNSIFPCECNHWHEWYFGHGEYPDCQKCKEAIEHGIVPKPEEVEE